MKTKIIYISGGEIFNMSDVRSALDCVRHELGLGPDTVLFGVPVDAEDALQGQFDSVQMNIVKVDTNTNTAESVIETPTKNETTSKPKRKTKKSVVLEETAVPEVLANAEPDVVLEENKNDKRRINLKW